MKQKSSHVIDDEINISLEDFRTVIYGHRLGVYRITVKGMFQPTVARKQNEYIEAGEKTEKAIKNSIQRKLATLPHIHHHTIVITDITVKGHKLGKPSKIKYTFYVTPLEIPSDERDFVIGIVEEITPSVRKSVEVNGFSMSKVPYPDNRNNRKRAVKE